MDFLDCLVFPHVAHSNYSPIDETSYPNAFSEVYIADSYTTSPDLSLASFLDFDSSCDRTPSSVEVPSFGAFALGKLPAASSALALSNTPCSPTYKSSGPFRQLEQLPSGFSFDTIDNQHDTSVSPPSQQSRTPSLCDDTPQQSHSTGSSEFPQRLPFKRKSTINSAQNDEEPILKRKRGRPLFNRSNSDISAESTRRVPHNQVERKYRAGLNAKLERLRCAVPTLPQIKEGGGMGHLKPSKAMVLTGAIGYIKKVERERDTYRDEIERLRSFGH